MTKINILLCTLFLAFACTAIDENNIDKEQGNPDIGIAPEQGNSDLINQEIFTTINLEFPGLEQVKHYYNEKDYYRAAAALLNYYRGRTNVFNPGIKTQVKLSSAGKSIADQALEHRFYVRNYKESINNGLEQYWSFDKDGKIDWTFCPSGADKEFNIQKHRHQWMIYQAEAYHQTGDETYVLSWIEVTKDWWAAYPYQEGPNNYTEGDGGTPEEIDYNRAWTGLQPAERLLDALNIFCYMLPAQNFTPEWLSEYLVMMSKTADKIKVSPVDGEDSNIRLAQDQAIATIAMLMPEFAHAGEWMEHGIQEITRHLNNQFNEDGVQNELDPGYHMGVIGNFLKVYDIAKTNGLLDKFPSYYVQRLKNACNFMADIIWPDYSIDYFNDTKAMSNRVLLRNMKTYASYFPDDEEIQWMANEGTTKEPESKVKIYDKSGWYMMMNGWKKSSMKLIIKNNYNPFNRWHCQNDNGTISVYKNGRCFTPDPGAYSYGGTTSTNADRARFAATRVHNTLTKNGYTIADGHSKGKLLKAESKNDYELIVTENKSYDDLTHRRAVYMVEDEFYVIVDDAYGPAQGVDAILNFSLCTDEQNNNIHVVQTDDFSEDHIYGVHTEFGDGNNMLFRTFTDCTEGYQATTYEDGEYSPSIGVSIPRKRYTVKVKKNAGQEARFITVIRPFSSPSEAEHMEIHAAFKNAASNTPTNCEIEVVVNGKTYNLKYSI